MLTEKRLLVRHAHKCGQVADGDRAVAVGHEAHSLHLQSICSAVRTDEEWRWTEQSSEKRQSVRKEQTAECEKHVGECGRPVCWSIDAEQMRGRDLLHVRVLDELTARRERRLGRGCGGSSRSLARADRVQCIECGPQLALVLPEKTTHFAPESSHGIVLQRKE